MITKEHIENRLSLATDDYDRETALLALAGLDAQWRTMETRPPNTRVLVAGFGWIAIGSQTKDRRKPIAWMPLPKPPEVSR